MCFLFEGAGCTWRTKNYMLEMQTQVLKDFKGITNFTAFFLRIGLQHLKLVDSTRGTPFEKTRFDEENREMKDSDVLVMVAMVMVVMMHT